MADLAPRPFVAERRGLRVGVAAPRRLVEGADAGAVVAFIVSWTLIGYTRALVWELPFFGADFVIWRMVAAIPLPIIAGLLARIAVRAGFQYRDEIK